MAKAKDEEKVNAVWAGFADGPRAGSNMRVAKPPAEWLRLAFPEWCTYRWNAALGVYEYQGSDPPPVQQRSAPIVDTSRLHVPPIDFSHRDSPGWAKGLADAEVTMAEAEWA